MSKMLHIGCVVLAVVICLVVGSSAEEVQWILEGTSPINGGYGEAVVGTGDQIYIARCLYASSTPQFYRYDPAYGAWYSESVNGLPEGAFRTGTALAWDGERYIYALGGARYSDSKQRSFYQYDSLLSSWTILPDTPFAQGAGDALTYCGLDQRLYMFIGSREHNCGASYFTAFDPGAETWEILQFPWTFSEDGATLAWTGGDYIYALRGECDETEPNGEFSRFSISLKTWESLSDFPGTGGIGDGGSLLWVGQWEDYLGDTLYALSGGSATEDPGYEFYRYSILANQWERDADIPCPIGYYVGNRLGYASGKIYYWQGSPQSDRWVCGGGAFFASEINITPPRHVLINEIEMNPLSSDSGAEWMEIYNPTSKTVSLAGWAASYTGYGGGWDPIPPVSIEPGGYYQFMYPKQHLENSRGGIIQLRDAAREVVDETAEGLTDTHNDARTWQRFPDGSDPDSLDDWIFTNGTPGHEN